MMSDRRGLWPQRSTIDLRSDTVTQPTGGMRKAMQKVLSEVISLKQLLTRIAQVHGQKRYKQYRARVVCWQTGCSCECVLWNREVGRRTDPTRFRLLAKV